MKTKNYNIFYDVVVVVDNNNNNRGFIFPKKKTEKEVPFPR
jgi:hypothetical protein